LVSRTPASNKPSTRVSSKTSRVGGLEAWSLIFGESRVFHANWFLVFGWLTG
jgi:hypothetical protein